MPEFTLRPGRPLSLYGDEFNLGSGGDGDDSNGRAVDDATPHFSDEEPMLVPMDIKNMYFVDGQMNRVYMPFNWVSKLVPNDLHVVPGVDPVIHAHTKGEPSRDVWVGLVSSSSVEDRRLVAMMKRLRGVPNVVSYFDSQVFPKKTYVLMEAVPGDSLAIYNGRAGLLSPDRVGRSTVAPALPLQLSLPVLVDILYAVVGLERAGVIHPWLWEDSIYFSEGRALVAGFAHMCAVDRKDEFGRDSFTNNIGSALRTAPEMVDGRPTGLSNTIWAVGMIFGRMCLGDIPTREAVSAALALDGETRALDSTPIGRYDIRQVIRTQFSIRTHSRFRHLDKDIKELLTGLLEPSPNRRWSASGALSHAIKVSEERGIKLSAPRKQVTLPEGWLDWE